MPVRREIGNVISNDLYSIQLYDRSFDFNTFSPDVEFDKLAGMEVSDFKHIPTGMEAFTLDAGLYAVFIHRGSSTDAPRTFSFIFGTMLNKSEYEIDFRPHFEILGEKYKNNDPGSEEEVWIPVRPRA